MKTQILLSIIILPLWLPCQVPVDFATHPTFSIFEEAEHHYLLADQVILRDTSSRESKGLGVLSIGTPMVILEREEKETIQGLAAYWYKITTAKQIGWIWGGYIAQQTFGSSIDSRVKFVAGFKREEYDPEEGAMVSEYQIRALRDGKQLDKVVIHSFGEISEKLYHLGNQGLGNIDDLFKIRLPCVDGISCSGGERYIVWSGEKFHQAADFFSFEKPFEEEYQRFIFPTEMAGTPDFIIKENGFIAADNNPQDSIWQKRVYQREFLQWDGQKLVCFHEMTLRKTYKLKIKKYDMWD